MQLSAIILSAGRSSRLPGFKPLLPLDGMTMLARAANLFRTANVNDIIAVTGYRADEVKDEALRNGIRPVLNPHYEDGMLSSVLAGLAALPLDTDAVFVLPVDMPLLRTETVRALAERMRHTQAQALIPTFHTKPGHPPLLRTMALPRIRDWKGENGLAGALTALDYEEVPVADRHILFDVDDDAAFAEAMTRVTRQDVATPAEALALLDLHDAGERGHAHARGVADVALALGRALNACGYGLDLELIESAALLHDIAKGHSEHEKIGGALLYELGYPHQAAIIAAHRDIDPAGLTRPTERELVYLADKLVRGPKLVGVAQRFQEKLDHFAHDEAACEAIMRRQQHAQEMISLVEKCAKSSLQKILSSI